MENSGHITEFKSDKVLLSDVPCLCIGSLITKSGHEFSDKRVFFYPDEVYSGEDGKCEIFFVPAIPVNGSSNPEKIPVPIFMLKFSPHQKREIISYGEINGLKILMKHFHKPKITMTYEERGEGNEEVDDDTG
jgi:hypothetical protein